jgi:hypothetical protein
MRYRVAREKVIGQIWWDRSVKSKILDWAQAWLKVALTFPGLKPRVLAN